MNKRYKFVLMILRGDTLFALIESGFKCMCSLLLVAQVSTHRFSPFGMRVRYANAVLNIPIKKFTQLKSNSIIFGIQGVSVCPDRESVQRFPPPPQHVCAYVCSLS